MGRGGLYLLGGALGADAFDDEIHVLLDIVGWQLYDGYWYVFQAYGAMALCAGEVHVSVSVLAVSAGA